MRHWKGRRWNGWDIKEPRRQRFNQATCPSPHVHNLTVAFRAEYYCLKASLESPRCQQKYLACVRFTLQFVSGLWLERIPILSLQVVDRRQQSNRRLDRTTVVNWNITWINEANKPRTLRVNAVDDDELIRSSQRSENVVTNGRVGDVKRDR